LEIYKATLPNEPEQTKSVKVVFLDGKVTTTTTPVAATTPTTTPVVHEDVHPIFQSRYLTVHSKKVIFV
jgi:hypothetical protein